MKRPAGGKVERGRRVLRSLFKMQISGRIARANHFLQYGGQGQKSSFIM